LLDEDRYSDLGLSRDTLFGGVAWGPTEREQLVNDVLLPLLRG
jgi:hypothetical protein